MMELPEQHPQPVVIMAVPGTDQALKSYLTGIFVGLLIALWLYHVWRVLGPLPFES